MNNNLNHFMKTLNLLYLDDSKESSDATIELLKEKFGHIQIEKDIKKGIKKYSSTNEKIYTYDIVIINTDENHCQIDQSTLSHHHDQHIIVMSKHDMSDSIMGYIQMGILTYIPKPINLVQLQSNLYTIALSIQTQKTIKEQYKEIQSINANLKTAKQNAERASYQKSSFLANMSHEIRTPLNAITGFISLLHENETDTEKITYLNVVKSASDSLLKVISDILDITKIENGKLEIEHIPFDPYEELIVTTELFQAKAAEKDVGLNIRYNHTIPHTLISDPFRIKQILSNLLSNAIKFTPTGSSVKCVIWYAKGILNIKVKDYGIGIVKEKHEYIFEAFHQADNIMATEYGGTGLGLALCAELTQLLGGSLSLEDNKAGGSIFTLSIKMPSRDEKLNVTANKKINNSNTQLEGHILIAEDIEANRMFLSIILDNANLTYDMAVNGIDAIEKFNQNTYDLILMDENMPQLRGSQAAKEIKKREKELDRKPIPIISLTANALKGDEERFLDAGMDGYLSKPVEPKILLDMLNKHL